MKAKKLKALVQKRINAKAASQSKHFPSARMEMQVEALIEVIAHMVEIPEEKEKANGKSTTSE